MLYAEGETSPKMMSVGLHCRVVGRPGRAAALMRFLDYIMSHERVWVPTRLQIAEHWHANWRIWPRMPAGVVVEDVVLRPNCKRPHVMEAPGRPSDPMLGNAILDRIVTLAVFPRRPAGDAHIPDPRAPRRGGAPAGWMRDAGMQRALDAIGNVCGRYEGDRPGLPCLMLGSHYDTVRDAGKWDGPLGLITAIACVD